MAFRGESLTGLAFGLLNRLNADPDDAAAILDLGTVHVLMGQIEAGLRYQPHALVKRQIYRDGTAAQGDDCLRLLAFAAPGDLMSNVPVQFLLENSDIRLDVLYVVPGLDLPETVPDHDLAMVIVGESAQNRPILERIASFADIWPRQPVLNDPRRLLNLTRDGVSALIAGADGIFIPTTVRIDADTLARLGRGELKPGDLAADAAFPVIVRPRDSHAGRGLAKLEDADAIAAYMTEEPAEEYYLARFIDYASPDGLFRKYRVAMIDGRPYICHMAVSSHWMIHYLNADMENSQDKRDEEARAFATFDHDFVPRHRVAFDAMTERFGLDYFIIDCGEMPDGSLLLFEANTPMIVHAMDSAELFPYKPPQMHRVFRAFQDMLRTRAGKKDAS